MRRTGARVDPVTLEIVRNSLVAIVDEMETNVARTAYSPNVYEVKDFCAGLLDPQGYLIAQARGGLPIFLADLGVVIEDAIRIYGEDGIEPGDVLLTNDPDVCGQHLMNTVLFTPIFHEGRIIAFAAVRAHWTDIGGRSAGGWVTDTTEIFQEGLQIPTIKVYKRGEPDDELLRMIAKNIRLPTESFGDMRAQLAACRLAETRFTYLLNKYGVDQVQACIEEGWNQTEQLTRQEIGKIPDGVYEAESFLDNDGVDLDKSVHVKVKVVIEGDEMTVDFSEVAEQVRGSINSGRSGGIACARVALKCLATPLLPADEGAFRPLKVVLPEGKFISARRPAPMSLWSPPLATVIDTILLAMAKAMPDRIPAAHRGDVGGYLLAGRNPERDNRLYVHLDSAIGGWGGRPWEDGPCGMKSFVHGDTYSIAIEAEETFFPVIVDRYALRPDSGGAGRWRGGLGNVKMYHAPYGTYFCISFDRSQCLPWGLHGGKPGMGNTAVLHKASGESIVVQKVTDLLVEPGDELHLLLGGGGGWGHPLDREPERVRLDVRRGYVSLETARADYGVVLDPDTLAVDVEATERLRARMREGGRAE